MRGVWVLLFFFGSCAGAVAQPARVTSLERAVAEAAGENKSAALVRLAAALELADPAAAETRAQEALQLATTPAARLRAEAQLIALQRRRGDYAPALSAARAGLERASALHDDALRVAFLYMIAQTHWSLTQYPEAIATYQEVIALARKAGDALHVARAETGIGIIHAETRQWALAPPHYERALAAAAPLEDGELRAWILNNLGNYYNGIDDFPRARATHLQALAIRRAEGNDRGEADSLLNLGDVEIDAGELSAALAYTQTALAIYERLGLKRHQFNARAQLAGVLRRLGRTDESLEHQRIALGIAESLGSQALLATLYNGQAQTHEARGDFRAALDATRKTIAAREAAAGERTRQQITALNVRYETERREHELDLLRRDQRAALAELSRGRVIRYSLGAVLGLSAVAFIALFSRQRLKLRSERRIHEETRAAQAAAEAAVALKTRLLGITSHDLKGPLRSIVRAAEQIEAAPDDREKVLRHARLMRGTSEQMFTLVRDLIDVAALEAGQLRLERALVDVRALAAEVVAAHEPRAQEKEQPFTFSASAAASFMVSADRGRLRQAIDNLVGNAIKFTPVGRAVRVTLAREADIVRFVVQDEGPGLTPEDYARLFQPFQLLSALPTGGESSTGLGLSIAREIVALHGGQLIVDSVPGEGATFSIELPAA